MGRYMIGRQCVKEQGNRKLQKQTRAQTGQDERKCPKLAAYKQSQGPHVRTNVERLDTGTPTISSAPIKRRNTLKSHKKGSLAGTSTPMALIRKFAREPSIGRTKEQQSTNNSPNLLTTGGGLHEFVALHSPLEPPGKEEHVHLE